MDVKEARTQKRQDAAYRLLRCLALPYFTRKFNASFDEEPKLDGPALVICNHVTELDFFFAARVFKTPMNFVIGRGLLQNPLLGYFLVNIMGAIPKQKGTSDPSTTMAMLRRLRQGRNVCLFAEGNTTFNGRTGPFPAATGGLLRVVGASLVILRIEGAYFALPRWGRGIRRGRTAVRVAGVYTKEQLAGMSAEEVNAVLEQGLQEDAYKRQESEQVTYYGKNTAEGLEHALYLCPACHAQNSLNGYGDRLVCGACKTEAAFTPQGYLKGGFRFETIADWTDWQREELKHALAQDRIEDLPFDERHSLYVHGNDGALEKIAEGPMAMDGQGLVVGDFEAPLLDILGFEIYRKKIIQFTLKNGMHYQSGPKPGFNALKYRDLFELAKERD